MTAWAKCETRSGLYADCPDGCYKIVEAESCLKGAELNMIYGVDFKVDRKGNFCHGICALNIPSKPLCSVTEKGDIEIYQDSTKPVRMSYTGETCQF